MSAYDVVLKSREKGRPTAVRYISNIVEGFIELHGDRRFADDRAVIGGVGTIGGGRSPSSASKRAKIPPRALHTTSAAPIPKATARRCA